MEDFHIVLYGHGMCKIVENIFILFSSTISKDTTVTIGMLISQVLVEIEEVQVIKEVPYKGLIDCTTVLYRQMINFIDENIFI